MKNFYYQKIILAVIFLSTSIWTFAQTKKTILFVCEHGAGRSVVAASYFNMIAQKKGLNYQAIFRGITPQEALGVSTRNGLIKDSIDVTNFVPTKISKNDVKNAFKVVTIDCTLPNSLNKADAQWTDIQWTGNYDVSKNDISIKVDELILTLPKQKKRK